MRLSNPRSTLTAAARRVFVPPPPVWALSLLLVVAGGGVLLGVAMPMSDRVPGAFHLVFGFASLGFALVLWLLGGRTPEWLMHATLVAVTAATTAMVASSYTEAGLVLTTFAYRAVIAHGAYFFSRRAAAAHAGLITAGYAIALAIKDVRNAPLLWLVTTTTVWAIVLIIGTLTSKLRAQAESDALTGTLNRQGLSTMADTLLAQARRTRNPLTVAIVDLDEFKSVNDSRGHVAGDLLLADAARTWQRTLRGSDVLARHGGDEFVLLLPGTTVREADALLARMRERSPAAFSHGLSVSRPDDTLESCLIRADAELYRRKAEPQDARVALPARPPL